MKYSLLVVALLAIPFIAMSQGKKEVKSQKPAKSTTTASGVPYECSDNANGLHLVISGVGFDQEGVTNVNGNHVFTNVPAGDMVITKTGEDQSRPTCRFTITCQGNNKSCTRSGTFAELNKGFTFSMPSAGNVTFGVK